MNTATKEPILNTAQAREITLNHHANRYDLTQTPLLKKQTHNESQVRSYPRRIPIAVTKAKGPLVEDEQGRTFLDCLAGAGVLALGHNHPEINQAIVNAIQNDCPQQTLDLTSPAKSLFMDALLDALPAPFSQNCALQFCGPTGADAVEAAIKLAKIVTGRENICSFYGGYHGMTHGALALTGNLSAKAHVSNLMPGVHFLPYPYAFRSPFLHNSDITEQSLHFIRSQLADPESGITLPAAIIVEPIQGEGGVIPAPIAWLKGLRALCDEFNIVLIFDEVQSGFGRTGKMFAFEHADIQPDILIMSKALGGGLPLAMIAFDKSLDAWTPGQHTGTFRGNQLAMVAGTVSLDIIKRDNLLENVNTLGAWIKKELHTLQQNIPEIGEVRGKGFMLGIEFIHHKKDTLGHPQSHPDFCKAVQQETLKRGMICEIGGRHGAVLRLLPPLIINQEHAYFIVSTLTQAIEHVKSQRVTQE